MGQNFWQYCKINAISFWRAWKLIPFAVLVENFEFGRLFCHFRRFTFHWCLSCAGTPRRFFWRFFATAVILSPLPGPYVHEQVQGLLQVPGPLASTPHHPIDRACKFDSHAFCPQPHHPLRSIYNVTTSRNIYIPPPHTIQSITPTMFASTMNVNIPPHTIHCKHPPWSCLQVQGSPPASTVRSFRTVITSALPHRTHCIHISTVCARWRNGNIPPPHTIHWVASSMCVSSRNGPPTTLMRSIHSVCKFKA